MQAIPDSSLPTLKPGLFEGLSPATRFRMAGWFFWLTLVVTVTFTVLAMEERSVTPAYRSAVTNWFSGEPLYNMQGHGFLYLPQAALTFAPWTILPYQAGEVLWRLFMIGVVASSVARLTKCLNGDVGWFGVASFCSCAMAWGCARNGQSTLLITGMMIHATLDLSDRQWWRASALLALAFAVKPLAFVLIMLAAVVYPQTSWRLFVCLTAVFVIPFATQQPQYVISQYTDCLENLRVTFRVGDTEYWAQLYGMLDVAGLVIPSSARNLIRLMAAIGTLCLCTTAVLRLSRHQAAFYVYAFASCYLMLFNSRTEGNTYAMVGPVYGILLAEVMFRTRDKTWTWILGASVVLSVANYDLAILISPRDKAVWISPLVCCIVGYYLVTRLVQDIRRLPVDNDLKQVDFHFLANDTASNSPH